MAQESERPIQSAAESDLHFGPFRLEMQKRLWHGEHLVALRPRALAVLRYLAERPGQLVTTEEFLTHLWPRLYVTKTVLRVCVHAIRHALQDSPIAPRFIETVGRQGYRFVGAVSAPSSALAPSRTMPGSALLSPRPSPRTRHPIHATSSDASRNWLVCTRPSRGRSRASARWCFSRASRGLARRHSSIAFWPRSRREGRCGLAVGSVWNSMARGKRIYPCWRRWDSCVRKRVERTCWPSCVAMPRCG